MDVIQSNASARRNLLLERIYDAYPAADGGSSGGDEEYFFSFAQNSVISLKNSFRAAVHAGLKLEQCQQGKCLFFYVNVNIKSNHRRRRSMFCSSFHQVCLVNCVMSHKGTKQQHTALLVMTRPLG